MNCNIQPSPESNKMIPIDKGKSKELNTITDSDDELPVTITPQPIKKRGRGRPKGSFNVKKDIRSINETSIIKTNHLKNIKAKGVEKISNYNPWDVVDEYCKDGLTSQDRLINFLFNDGGINMRKYLVTGKAHKKDNQENESKSSLLSRCVSYFADQNVFCRTPLTIKSKIRALLIAYRNAHHIEIQSGRGSNPESVDKEFEDRMNKICPHYYKFRKVMTENSTESSNSNNSNLDLSSTTRMEKIVTLSSDDNGNSSETDSSQDEDENSAETTIENGNFVSDKKRKRTKLTSFFKKMEELKEDHQKELVQLTNNYLDQKSRIAIFKIRLNAMFDYAMANHWDWDQLNEASGKLQDEIFSKK